MCYNIRARGCSSMAERQLPKLNTRVRFPSPAPRRRGLRIVRDDDFSFRTIVIAHSLRRSSFSKLNPLRWASIWGFIFCKVRSTSFPATAKGYCRKLRSLPCASFQIRSTRLRICFLLSSGLRIVRDDDFSFRTIVIAHSLRRSSFSKLNPLRWASIWGFIFCKVRSASFPATAYGYCRKLRSLPCASFQIRSTRLRICFFIFRS